MDLFSVDFSPNELSILRQSLDVITITGKDAKTIANLQVKLEHEITQIADLLSAKTTKKTK